MMFTPAYPRGAYPRGRAKPGPTAEQVAAFMAEFGALIERALKFTDKNEFVADVVSKGQMKAKFSPAQAAALEKTVARMEQQAAERAAEAATAQPIPAEMLGNRIMVAGTVLTVAERVGRFGPQIKMLVKAEAGWKVWGTVPAAASVRKGHKVEFMAKVELARENPDPKFGFFNRPTALRVTEPAELPAPAAENNSAEAA